MECNKEEALRAKVIAERKMESKDFAGARKIALKAQNLYPDLENVTQIMCVCDVHCSAENKNLGTEKDWYAVLKVEQSADETAIKKQYRKLALLLHPDKNKFPGAEAAFKLIGEAQRVLLDKDKRNFYDIRYRRFPQNLGSNKPPQANKSANNARQPWGPNNMNYASSHVNWPPKPEASTKFSTCMTTCPFCKFQVPYYKDGSKVLMCQSCKQQFIVAESYAQWVPPVNNLHQTAKYTKVDIPNHGVNHSASNGRPQGMSGPQMPGGDSFAKSGQSNKVNMNAGKMNTESSAGTNPARKDNVKRGKKRAKEDSSDDSFDSDSSTDCEDAGDEKGSDAANINRRRSSRSKRHVSYNENKSDDDEVPSSDTPLKSKSTNSTEESGKGGTVKANGNDPVVKDNVENSDGAVNDCDSDSDSDGSPEAQTLEVPDPDFSDFDQLRNGNLFKTGQIWAVYDTLDAMPRFYAYIKRVYVSGFKVNMQWLEADPDEGDALRWVDKELPYSCGKFCKGQSNLTENLEQFSHLMLEKVIAKDLINLRIYPKKGETWAVFSGWSMDWISEPDVSKKKYEYEFVEVLTEYNGTAGIRVAFLGKVKGLISVFCRTGAFELQIPPGEMLRFSHRVPSFKMTGNERDNVPAGSFELDPASVPLELLKK